MFLSKPRFQAILFITVALLASQSMAPAFSETSTTKDKPKMESTTGLTGLTGWNEAVITTLDSTPWAYFFTEIAGWEERTRASIDDGLKKLWNLPENAKGTEILYANKGANKGFIRLIQLENVEQNFIRSDDRPWDTGGIFDLNVRVTGMKDVHKKMLTSGWQGDSEPISYVFGPFEVSEWIARGPDGVRLAVIERHKPILEGWPNLKVISRTFNSTQIVDDIEATREFYEKILGMSIYLEHRGSSPETGPNVLGLPHEAAKTIEREIYVLHPLGTNEGSIEIIKFHGASGSDLSARAAPHNIGVSTLRFPVADLDKTISIIKKNGGKILVHPIEMTLAPYGKVNIIAIQSPEGARLEIYSPK